MSGVYRGSRRWHCTNCNAYATAHCVLCIRVLMRRWCRSGPPQTRPACRRTKTGPRGRSRPQRPIIRGTHPYKIHQKKRGTRSSTTSSSPHLPDALPPDTTHTHNRKPSRHSNVPIVYATAKPTRYSTAGSGGRRRPSALLPSTQAGPEEVRTPPLPPNANSPPHHLRAGARGEEGPRHHSRRMPTPLPVCRRILYRVSTHYGAVQEGQRRPVSSQTWVYRRATQPQHHPSSLSVNRCSSGSSYQRRPQKRPPPTAPLPPPRRRRRHFQTPPSARRPPPPLRAPPPRRLRDDGGWRPPWWPQGGPPLEAAPGGPWQRTGRGERCGSWAQGDNHDAAGRLSLAGPADGRSRRPGLP